MKRISTITALFAFLMFGPLVVAEEQIEKKEKDTGIYYRIAAGIAADARLNRIVRGDLTLHDDRTGIIGFEIGKAIVEDFRGWPLDLVAKAGLIRHFERDFQDDFYQFTLSIKVYYKGFPWRDRVDTRFGFAEGLSYAQRIPFIEQADLGEDENTSHLLNHLDVSLDANIGDLFGQPNLRGCYFGFAVSHRSGVFGLFDIFGRVRGGSNYNTLYVECIR